MDSRRSPGPVTAASLLVALLPMAACVSVAPPMIVPPSAEEKAAAWHLVRVGPDVDGWTVEAIFVPGRNEDVLGEGGILVQLDGRPVPFTLDPSYQRLRASFPVPPRGDHLFTAEPAAGHPRLTVRFTVAP